MKSNGSVLASSSISTTHIRHGYSEHTNVMYFWLKLIICWITLVALYNQTWAQCRIKYLNSGVQLQQHEINIINLIFFYAITLIEKLIETCGLFVFLKDQLCLYYIMHFCGTNIFRTLITALNIWTLLLVLQSCHQCLALYNDK